jgi:hypothetical protein
MEFNWLFCSIYSYRVLGHEDEKGEGIGNRLRFKVWEKRSGTFKSAHHLLSLSNASLASIRYPK